MGGAFEESVRARRGAVMNPALWCLHSHCREIDSEVEDHSFLSREVHDSKLHIKRILLAAGLR